MRRQRRIVVENTYGLQRGMEINWRQQGSHSVLSNTHTTCTVFDNRSTLAEVIVVIQHTNHLRWHVDRRQLESIFKLSWNTYQLQKSIGCQSLSARQRVTESGKRRTILYDNQVIRWDVSSEARQRSIRTARLDSGGHCKNGNCHNSEDSESRKMHCVKKIERTKVRGLFWFWSGVTNMPSTSSCLYRLSNVFWPHNVHSILSVMTSEIWKFSVFASNRGEKYNSPNEG